MIIIDEINRKKISSDSIKTLEITDFDPFHIHVFY